MRKEYNSRVLEECTSEAIQGRVDAISWDNYKLRKPESSIFEPEFFEPELPKPLSLSEINRMLKLSEKNG